MEPVLKVDTEKVLAREVEGELVILDLNEQRYLGGNPTVAVLWPLLEQGTTRDELLTALMESFEVERERAAEDLEALLRELRRLGLLEGPDDSTAGSVA